jgi:hypothetical protein
MPVTNNQGSRKIKYILIVVPVLGVAFALAMFNSQDEINSSTLTTSDNGQRTELVEPTEEDLTLCYSVNSELQFILGVDRDNAQSSSPDISKTRLAIAILIDEFCKRPVLVQEIMSTSDPSMQLVAYACDGSTGKLGDNNFQQVLMMFSLVYCDASSRVMTNQADNLLEGIEGFRSMVFPPLAPEISNNEIAEIDSNRRAIESSLEKVIESISKSKSLLDSGMHYQAAMSLEEGSNLFAKLIAEELE